MSPARNTLSRELRRALRPAPDWRPVLSTFQRDHWDVLRYATRNYLLALLDLTARGRTAVADLMDAFDGAFDSPSLRHPRASRSVPALPWLEEARAHRHIGELDRWIISQLQSEPDHHAGFADLEVADAVFDEFLPALADSLRDNPKDEETFQTYATSVVVILGVMSDAGSHAAITLLERHGTLEPVTQTLKGCQRFDHQRVDTLLPYFADILIDEPNVADDVEGSLNNAYMMTVGLIRAFQDQFDLARIGFVPGEVVAHAVERFTGLIAALNDSPSDLSQP